MNWNYSTELKVLDARINYFMELYDPRLDDLFLYYEEYFEIVTHYYDNWFFNDVLQQYYALTEINEISQRKFEQYVKPMLDDFDVRYPKENEVIETYSMALEEALTYFLGYILDDIGYDFEKLCVIVPYFINFCCMMLFSSIYYNFPYLLLFVLFFIFYTFKLFRIRTAQTAFSETIYFLLSLMIYFFLPVSFIFFVLNRTIFYFWKLPKPLIDFLDFYDDTMGKMEFIRFWGFNRPNIPHQIRFELCQSLYETIIRMSRLEDFVGRVSLQTHDKFQNVSYEMTTDGIVHRYDKNNIRYSMGDNGIFYRYNYEESKNIAYKELIYNWDLYIKIKDILEDINMVRDATRYDVEDFLEMYIEKKKKIN